MKAEIIIPNSDVKRERWGFTLLAGTSAVIYFDDYIFEAKDTIRHKWRIQSRWSRLNSRESNIACPQIPAEIEIEMRRQFMAQVEKLEVKK